MTIVKNFNSYPNTNTNFSVSFSSMFLCKILVIFYLFNFTKLKKSSNRTNIPDELENSINTILDHRNKECIEEIGIIYKKDFKSSPIFPYQNISNQEKTLNRTLTRINKRLNKYNFYEGKNFTGIRWIDTKSYNGEIKRIVEENLGNIIEFFEGKYIDCKNTLPEIIIENYQLFFNKVNEIKKVFQKFYLFKGVKKFLKCMAKTNSSYITDNFGDNLRKGKITISKLLGNLKNLILAVMEIVKKGNITTFSKSLKSIILNIKSFPVL